MAINSSVRWFHSEMAGAPVIEDVAGGIIGTLKAGLIDGFGSVSVTGISVTSEVATLTATAHGFEKHAVITIAGATPSGLNGDWRIATVPTADTLTFAAPGLGDGAATGTITAIRATPGYWEEAWTGTNKSAFRSTHPDGTGLHFRIDDSPTGTSSSPVRGYETMTGIDTGANPFPTEAQVTLANYVWRRTNTSNAGDLPRPWALVADERWFCLLLDFRNVATNPGALYQFGDPVGAAAADAYAGYITGHTTSNPTAPNASSAFNHFGGVTTGQYWARNRAGTLGPVLLSRWGHRNTFEPGDGEPYPAQLNNGYLFHHPCTLNEDGAAGILRGQQPAFWQGLTALDTLGADPFRILDPSADLPVALLLYPACRGATGAASYIGFDIWGPWR